MEEFDVFTDEDFDFSDTPIENVKEEEKEKVSNENTKEKSEDLDEDGFTDEDFDFNESIEDVSEKQSNVDKEKKETSKSNLSNFGLKLDKLGYLENLKDEDGNPIDPNSITEEEEEDLIEAIIQNKAQEDLRNLINSLPPELKELNKFIIKDGGNLKDYLNNLNAETVDFLGYEELPEDKAEMFLKKELQDLGYDDEDIDLQIETLKDNNKLVAYSQKRFSNWKVKEKKKKIELAEKNKAQELEKRKQIESFHKDLKSVFENKDLGGLKITPKKSKELYDYATKVIAGEGKAMPQLHRDVLSAFNDPKKVSILAAIVKDDFNLDKIAKQFKVEGKREITKKITNSTIVPLSELF